MQPVVTAEMLEEEGAPMGMAEGWWRRRGSADELATLRAELAAALDRAASAEQELAAVHAATEKSDANAKSDAAGEPDAAEGSDGADFGARAEQILRLAESQARATRDAAAREASALLQRTHQEAEAYRDVVGAELTARFEERERAAADREAALDARERELVEASEADRAAIKRLRSDALADADRIREAARAVADDIRGRAVSEAAAEMRHLRTSREPAPAGELEMLRLLSLDDEQRPPG